MSHIINGRKIAEIVTDLVKKQVDYLKEHYKVTPGLSVVQIGEDLASNLYVRNKIKKCKEVGILSFLHNLPTDVSLKQLKNKIDHLNNDVKTHGILVQMPLPNHIDAKQIISSIYEEKDVDGFHPTNIGKLSYGMDNLTACTPFGCLILLYSVLGKNFAGKKVVIIGRSNIVGKPLAMLLLNHDCSVTILHSKSVNIQAEAATADILIAAVGKPHLVQESWVKEGAIVIDVGINRNELNQLQGDVNFDKVKNKARAITSVPGGVGPMTVACLMHNVVKAVCIQKNIELPKHLDLFRFL